MKVFVLYKVLCDYTCGCIIVAAKNKKDAIRIIKEHRTNLNGVGVGWNNIEENLEEVIAGYYEEIFGGG
jgi:hypothetical protein